MVYSHKMSPLEIIKYYGSQAAACRAMNITPPAYVKYVKAGCFPKLRIFQLKVLLGKDYLK